MLEQFAPILSESAIWCDVTVERLTGDPQFSTERAHMGFGFPYRRHREAHFGRSHFEGRAAFASTRSRRRQPRLCSFGDQFSFILGQHGEDAEHQPDMVTY